MTTESAKPFYETDKAISEYLLFHYGKAEEQMPHAFGPHAALNYPVRCVTECLNIEAIPANARGLDLGCAVGRSTFELARHCSEVVGIDFSHAFIDRANQLKAEGSCDYAFTEQGMLSQKASAEIDPSIDRSRTRFQQGDAMHLPDNLGKFHVILMANLIDRLIEPKRCLDQLPDLMEKDGQLIITSPYTWLEEYTPKENWLGGFSADGKQTHTLEGLRSHLQDSFELIETKDLPFLIREHARKYQWSVAQASVLRRK
ncbi:MAG: putative 4-mercaptohistidine N1-methyltransferase [Verrucomicrobia bacterium]|jgi:putative 4-mercaptohistidine N1-methyltranferase|nr:putative 4-mercaptohistidine N1-methyltransferase [Verrucomicrobiota bacterium]